MFKSSFLSLLVFILFSSYLQSQDNSDWREEQNIYEKIYNAHLQLADGSNTTIRQLSSKSPLIVTLIFTRCTGVCYPLLLRLNEELKNADSEKFDVLVISFDPRDSIKDMINLSNRFGLENNKDWNFSVTDSIALLNKSVSFNPVWNDSAQQFNHDAYLIGVNNQSYITKKLIGMRDTKSLNALIRSINSEYSVTYRLPSKNNAFSCFNYDPVTGESSPGLGLLFIAIPPALSFLILITIRLVVYLKKKKFKEIPLSTI